MINTNRDKLPFPLRVLICKNLNNPNSNFENIKNIFHKLLKDNEIAALSEIETKSEFEKIFPYIGFDGQKSLMIKDAESVDDKLVEFFKKENYKIEYCENSKLINFSNWIPEPGIPIIWSDNSGGNLKGYDFLNIEYSKNNFTCLNECLLPINGMEAVVPEDTFSAESIGKLMDNFNEVYFIPLKEAINTQCLESLIILGKRKRIAIIPSGASELKSLLKRRLYDIYEIETDEWSKAGMSIHNTCKLYF